jgi:SNF2 family DNA or RNA helicase
VQQREYQQIGTEFLRAAGRGMLADEPGLGKTNQLLMAAEGKTLVVSPAMLEDVWMSKDPRDPGEIQRWRPDLDATWVSYSSLCERQGRRVLPRPRPEYRQEWDTVIFDESHYLKERKTLWTQAAQKLDTDRLFLATGTPLPNWGHEIFTSLQMMYPEKSRPGGEFGSYWRWVSQWFHVVPSQHNPQARIVGTLLPGWSWDDFTEQNGMVGRWLRRKRDDVLTDLPPLDQQRIYVDMTAEQAKVYRQVKKDLYAEIEATGNEIISWSRAGVHTKLLKLCTGIEAEDLDYTKDGCKISALREIMTDRTSPTLVFTVFRNSAEAVARAMRQEDRSVGVISGAYSIEDRKETARRFRAGEIQVLVGTLGTISEGLTLTAADTCIFLERDPRPSKNEQALRRIHRFGQDRPCLSIDLVAKGTVDVPLLALLAEKTDQQMAAMTAFDLAQLA